MSKLCCQIGQGRDSAQWLPMRQRITGPEFSVTHQSHYTSIVNLSTVDVQTELWLQEPLTSLPQHDYRMCQHPQVVFKGSAGKPIDLYNFFTVPTMVRQHILYWIVRNSRKRALIIGWGLSFHVFSKVAEWLFFALPRLLQKLYSSYGKRQTSSPWPTSRTCLEGPYDHSPIPEKA